MTTPPSPALVDGLRDLLAKATPGPWRALPEESDRPHLRVRGTRLGERYKVANVLAVEYDGAPTREANETRANAALIVAAVNALPALLDTLARLAGENERLKADHEAMLKALRDAANTLPLPKISPMKLECFKAGARAMINALNSAHAASLAANPQGATDERA